MLSEIKLRLNLAPCGASDTKKGLFETTDNFSISAVELLQRPDQAEHAPRPPPAPRPDLQRCLEVNQHSIIQTIQVTRIICSHTHKNLPDT